MAEESAAKPFYSVLVLAFFCSLMVAGAAVGLRPLQEQNRQEDRRKNILVAAGMYRANEPVNAQFSNIEARLVDLESGEYVNPDTIAPENYSQVQASMSDDLGHPIAREDDIAGLRRLEKYSVVYLVKGDQGFNQIVLPIRGKGLWSTMYGYIAIGRDLTTITGLSFYQHGETPGLGGEIENRRWVAQWEDKEIYDASMDTALIVGKNRAGVAPVHHIDGLSGATLTTNGVNNLVQFWFGENGFKPYLQKLHNSGGLNG